MNAVEEAYGNCEAIDDEEKNDPPWSQILEVVAADVVAKVLPQVKSVAPEFASVPQINTPAVVALTSQLAAVRPEIVSCEVEAMVVER